MMAILQLDSSTLSPSGDAARKAEESKETDAQEKVSTSKAPATKEESNKTENPKPVEPVLGELYILIPSTIFFMERGRFTVNLFVHTFILDSPIPF